MSILVTGGCGFIGSHVADELLKTYSNVVILDALYSCASLKNINPNTIFCKGNLCDIEMMDALFEKYKFKGVIHMAAQTHVDNSYKNSIQFTYDNVLATHVLLEVVRKHKCVDKFVYVSTDEVYGSTSDTSPNTIDSLLEPSNPYAATKAAAEMLVKSYIHSFKVPATIIRMNNVYGPRQYPEKMIPKFINAVLENIPIEIQGTGLQRRSILFVEDAAWAIVHIYNTSSMGEVINIPSIDEFTVIEVANLVLHAMNSNVEIKFVQDRPFNDRRYWIHDNTIQWKVRTSFEEGLRRTIEWYKNCPSDYWKNE